MEAKLPTGAVPTRPGCPVFQLVVASFQPVPVLQTAGPLFVALVARRLNRAEAMLSPAASAGTVNRTYDVARLALFPATRSLSTDSVVAAPAVAVGDACRTMVSALAVTVTVRVVAVWIV